MEEHSRVEARAKDNMKKIIELHYTTPTDPLEMDSVVATLNPASNVQIKALLNLDSIRYKHRKLVGKYKTVDKPKYKNIECELLPRRPRLLTTHSEVEQVDEATLKKLSEDKMIKGTSYEDLCVCLLELRLLSKEINTYYGSYAEACAEDGCIHANFNHTITPTGRVSSSGPNLQNVKG